MNVRTVGNVAEKLGITKRRFLYAEELGILPKAERTTDGKRFYLDDDLPELRKMLVKAGVLEPIEIEVN